MDKGYYLALAKVRMDRAKELLAESNMSVSASFLRKKFKVDKLHIA